MPVQFFACSREASANGTRFFILNGNPLDNNPDGWFGDDNRVSWYYQFIPVDSLTPEQIKKENEYRAKQGMKLVGTSLAQ